jgi:hypothetical protein
MSSSSFRPIQIRQVLRSIHSTHHRTGGARPPSVPSKIRSFPDFSFLESKFETNAILLFICICFFLGEAAAVLRVEVAL